MRSPRQKSTNLGLFIVECNRQNSAKIAKWSWQNPLSILLLSHLPCVNIQELPLLFMSKKERPEGRSLQPKFPLLVVAYSSVRSTISASGAFFITEAIPLFMLTLLAYIWLMPMICPLVAVKLKKGLPLVDSFLTKRLSS